MRARVLAGDLDHDLGADTAQLFKTACRDAYERFRPEAIIVGASCTAAVRRSAAPGDLIVLDRLFTYEPVALVLPRGADDLRLIVDRTLSRLYRSGEIAAIYRSYFGEPDGNALFFFSVVALPE